MNIFSKLFGKKKKEQSNKIFITGHVTTPVHDGIICSEVSGVSCKIIKNYLTKGNEKNATLVFNFDLSNSSFLSIPIPAAVDENSFQEACKLFAAKVFPDGEESFLKELHELPSFLLSQQVRGALSHLDIIFTDGYPKITLYLSR